jgi:hypothetical protein
LYNFLLSPIISSLFGPNTVLSTLFSNTPSPRSSVNYPNLICSYSPHESNFDSLWVFKYLTFAIFFEGSISCLYVMIWSFVNCLLG